jgi:hypothetical protein
MTPNSNSGNKPVVVSRLQVQDVIVLQHGRFQILTLTDDYQRNTIAAYKIATVKNLATGERQEMKFYANQRYLRASSGNER